MEGLQTATAELAILEPVQHEAEPQIDNEAILKALQRLLVQLAAPEQGPDIPLQFPTTKEGLDFLLAICEEIEQGADRLVGKHSQERNGFLPVHRIPEGVIAKILLAALSEEKYTWKGKKHTRLHRQKELRLVCTRWNKIIMDTPGFWSTLCCADCHEGRLQTALKLSSDELLDIICRSGGALNSRHYCRSLVAEMAKHVHRWRSLDVIGTYWSNYLTIPAPELTSITICGEKDSNHSEMWSGTFFGGAAPKLREITLKNFTVPWNAWPTFPSLERLEIRSATKGPTVIALLGIVSASKQLKELYINATRVEPLQGTDVWSAQDGPIECSNLQKLKLEQIRLDSIVQILNSLKFNGNCNVSISANNHDQAHTAFLDFLRRWIPEIRDKEGDRADSVCVDLDYRPTIGLCFPKHLWQFSFNLSDQKWSNQDVKWAECARILRDMRPAFGEMEGDPDINLWLLKDQVTRGLKLARDAYPKLARLCTVTAPQGTLELLSAPQPVENVGEEGRAANRDVADRPNEWWFPNLIDLHLYWQPDTRGLLEFVEARRNSPDVKSITKLVVDNSKTPEDVQEKLKQYVSDLRFRVI
ncbi:hypothetical protein FRB90_007257 [Tulasnella sp. 427]|nr:hypothetical protein FRB90_007257 [Tulasnella sp. 427]